MLKAVRLQEFLHRFRPAGRSDPLDASKSFHFKALSMAAPGSLNKERPINNFQHRHVAWTVSNAGWGDCPSLLTIVVNQDTTGPALVGASHKMKEPAVRYDGQSETLGGFADILKRHRTVFDQERLVVFALTGPLDITGSKPCHFRDVLHRHVRESNQGHVDLFFDAAERFPQPGIGDAHFDHAVPVPAA